MRINFHRCIVDDKESGSADEFMVSRVFFTIQDGDKTIPGVSVERDAEAGRWFLRRRRNPRSQRSCRLFRTVLITRLSPRRQLSISVLWSAEGGAPFASRGQVFE